ncbi:hypothetical protein EAH72_33440 [Pseudomonas caspiana]|nr:hypothetical protein [Pseudomonas caspiana]TPG88262.1 hypothetical protein EAH72_33440 [Pseudomonas caspiana]
MRYSLSRLYSLSIAGSLVIAPFHAHAGLLGLDFDAKVGIDKGTTRFLQKFPKEIRMQFVLGIQQSFDRTDLSIDKFFAHTQEALQDLQDTAGCLREDVVSIPKDAIDRMFGKGLDPVTVLNDQLDEARDAFTWTTTPERIRIKYADIDAKAVAVDCKFKSDLVQSETRIIRDKAANSWRLWARLDEQCDSSEDCYTVVSTALKQNLNTALQQDKHKVQAEQRFARMTPPPKSGGWFNSYKWKPYQTSLTSMLQLNDELLVATRERETKGKAALDALNASMAKINTQLAAGEAAVRKEGHNESVTACNIGYTIGTGLNGVESQIAQVSGYEVLSPVNLAKLNDDVAHARGIAAGWAKTNGYGIQNNKSYCSKPTQLPSRHKIPT